MAFDLGSIFDTAKAASGIFQGTQNASRPATPNTTSVIDQILAGINRPPSTGQNVADIGSILGAFSQGEKANRLSAGGLQQGYDRMMLDNQLAKNQFGLQSQSARNSNESDALRKLQQTSYIMGGGANYQAPSFMLGGQMRTAPSFSFAPQNTTPAEQAGAANLQGQLSSRLQPGGSFQGDFSYTPRDVNEYAKPGTMEQIGSYGGLGAGVLGGLLDIFGNKAVGDAAGGIGGMIGNGVKAVGTGIGKIFGAGGSGASGAASDAAGAAGAGGAGLGGLVLPGLGAATGIMGLMKDQGTGHNIANGATAGASIGSIVPGLGTGIGAGIGALVGALRGIGGPSQEELAGRETAGQARQALTMGATPAQIQEAGSAGWDKPQDALALIVLRDKLNAAGKPPAVANQLMDQLFQAEKHGPQAVQQVMNSISQALGGRV